MDATAAMKQCKDKLEALSIADVKGDYKEHALKVHAASQVLVNQCPDKWGCSICEIPEWQMFVDNWQCFDTHVHPILCPLVLEFCAVCCTGENDPCQIQGRPLSTRQQASVASSTICSSLHP